MSTRSSPIMQWDHFHSQGTNGMNSFRQHRTRRRGSSSGLIATARTQPLQSLQILQNLPPFTSLHCRHTTSGVEPPCLMIVPGEKRPAPRPHGMQERWS